MDRKRWLAAIALAWPLAIPAPALATGHTIYSAHSCAAIPDVPDQDATLAICAQIAQSGDAMTLIASGPAGATCLARVLYAAGSHRARLSPDGEELRAIGTGGRLSWHWSAAANARYGAHIDAFIACGRATSAESDEREVLFTVPGPLVVGGPAPAHLS